MADRISRTEFIAVLAMLFATIAFSMDAMLPALGVIAQELSPADPNRAQLVVTIFALGMGLGTFLSGPLSDSLGRKPVIAAGCTAYIVASAVAAAAATLELVLVARFVAGIGAAAPRVIALAVVRDSYEGREMARIMSFVLLIFMLFPAMAPLLGAGIIAVAGWRGIFWAFCLFGLVSMLWMATRLPETLPPPRRVPLRPARLRAGIAEVVGSAQVILPTAALVLLYASLFSMISVIQPIYEVTFGRADSFPVWFFVCAVIATSSTLLNARIVGALGMRRVAGMTFLVQACVTALALGYFLQADFAAPLAFAMFFLWQTTVFYGMGLTAGNLNAMALVPVGHIAGTASSVVGALSTVGAVAIAVPVGQAFDGTPVPAAIAILCFQVTAWAILRRLPEPEPAPTPQTQPEVA